MWEEIKEISNLIGIDDVAAIDFEPLAYMEKILHDRKIQEREISIEPQNILERINPSRHLREGRSILVFFWQIPFITEFIPLEKGYGQLASVSWGQDYHRVLGEKIQHVDEFLRKKVGSGYRSYQQVDTGPLYERGFALKTGLGYQGKNASFIHKRLGSFVAIGLLLTNIDIKTPREIYTDNCGACRKCIEACPGGAISPDGKINPNLCRSWISQKKGDLDGREEKILGNYLYGCDVCQRVCPKNQDIHTMRQVNNLLKTVKLSDLENLSNREFKKKFGHLSGAWRGLKTWKRNARIIEKNTNKNGTMYSDDR